MVEGRREFNVGAGSGMPPQRARSTAIQGPKKTQEELVAKVQENNMKAQEMLMQKTAASNQNFANTRIVSSKAVLMKNGKAVCQAFDYPNTRPVDTSKMRSSETTSFTQ